MVKKPHRASDEAFLFALACRLLDPRKARPESGPHIRALNRSR
jgi:hypothetical protein